MGCAQDLINAAVGELGYYAPDDPEAGSKYGRWMADLTGEDWLRGPSWEVWWCNIFVSWCLDQAGIDTVGYPSYNTDTTLAAGPALVYREDVQPGDIIIWDWNGDGATDHVGIALEHSVGELGYLLTIEGNHNNAVEKVDRSNMWGYVRACIRPSFGEGPTGPGNGTAYPTGNWIDGAAYDVIDGVFGNDPDRMYNLYAAVQNRVNEILA